jgi:hypothetical protein
MFGRMPWFVLIQPPAVADEIPLLFFMDKSNTPSAPLFLLSI